MLTVRQTTSRMATQRVEMESDFNLHTSYHKDFFLLRARVLVNGENTKITSVKEGSDEDPVMSFCHDSRTITTKFWPIANIISPLLQNCGIQHVNTFYNKQSLLFHVAFSSELHFEKFFLGISEVQCTMRQTLLSMISSIHGIVSPQSITVEVKPDLFLVSPDLHNAKGAELYLVTPENCSSSVTHWKNSKLLDFESLFQDEQSPSSESNRESPFPAVNDNMYETELLAAECVMRHSTTMDQKNVEGVQKPRSDLTKDFRKLVYGEELLRDLEDVQFHANQEASEVMTMLDELHKDIQKLAPEKHILEAKPKIEKQEGYPLMCKQEESEPRDTEICKLEQKLQEDELEREATVQEKKAKESIIEQLYAQFDEPPGDTEHSKSLSKYVNSNSAGSATLHLTAKPPKISTQPSSQKDILPGNCVTFTIQATGTEPLNYQWERKTSGEEGASKKSQSFPCGETELKVTGVQACNAGYYRCVVSNSAGSETSQYALLTVAKPPKITSQPSSRENILPGNCVAFIIQATGTEPLSYQWQWSPPDEDKGGSKEWQILNCDKVGLKVTGVQASAGYYRCVVSNSAGSDTSQCALLTVAAELSQALVRMEMKYLASELAQKHVYLTKLPTGESLEQLENNEITYSRTKEELVQEKNILIIDLQSKQKLLQLQSEVMADDSVYRAMLKDENTQNKRKIEILEEELQNVMSEFQQETRLHEEKFQTELKKNEETCWKRTRSASEQVSRGSFNSLKTQNS